MKMIQKCLHSFILLFISKIAFAEFQPDNVNDPLYDYIKFMKKRQASPNGARLTVDPPRNQNFPNLLAPQSPNSRGQNPSSISAGGSPQNPALFARTTFQPGQSPQDGRPSIAIAPSPVRPEIITVPLTTLTRESGVPQPLPPPPPPTTTRQPNTPMTEPITEPPLPPSPVQTRTPQRVVVTASPVNVQPSAARSANTPQTILFTRPPPTVQTPSSTSRSTTTRYKSTSTTTSSDLSGERTVANSRQPFVAPNGKTLLSPHVDNYCDMREYPDEVLAEKHLQRVEYFVGNLSCSRQFFECAVGQTYLMNCTSNEQVFDISTMNCNFRSSVKSCPEFDKISHCTIKEQCQADQFACCAMPQQCIPYAKRCDGAQDCSDGEDENNCPSCEADEFPCVKTGKCIQWTQRCNGIPDECFDQTNLDELNCQGCGPDKFLCSRSEVSPSQQPICFDITVRCNGVKECPKGEDELNCIKTKGQKILLCEDQKNSVNKEQWCDGTEDCIDGSDEQYCVFK